MASNNGVSKAVGGSAGTPAIDAAGDPRTVSFHPAWVDFVRFCARLQHGDIERLRIQDGLPVLAELTTKKVKFG